MPSAACSAQKETARMGSNHLGRSGTALFVGSPTWARTRDLRINSPSLYQLSYQGTAYDYSSNSHHFANGLKKFGGVSDTAKT